MIGIFRNAFNTAFELITPARPRMGASLTYQSVAVRASETDARPVDTTNLAEPASCPVHSR